MFFQHFILNRHGKIVQSRNYAFYNRPNKLAFSIFRCYNAQQHAGVVQWQNISFPS